MFPSGGPKRRCDRCGRVFTKKLIGTLHRGEVETLICSVNPDHLYATRAGWVEGNACMVEGCLGFLGERARRVCGGRFELFHS